MQLSWTGDKLIIINCHHSTSTFQSYELYQIPVTTKETLVPICQKSANYNSPVDIITFRAKYRTACDDIAWRHFQINKLPYRQRDPCPKAPVWHATIFNQLEISTSYRYYRLHCMLPAHQHTQVKRSIHQFQLLDGWSTERRVM